MPPMPMQLPAFFVTRRSLDSRRPHLGFFLVNDLVICAPVTDQPRSAQTTYNIKIPHLQGRKLCNVNSTLAIAA